MGLRFRKSIKVADGVKVNIGTKSAGVSVGGKYGGVSFNTKSGTNVHASAPGTGLSYTKKIGSKKKGKKSEASKIGSTILTVVIVIFAILFVVYKNWDKVSETLGLNKQPVVESQAPANGNTADTGNVSVNTDGVTYVLNTNTKKVHLTTCQYAGDGENFKKTTDSLDSILSNGYEKCKKCLK